MGGVAYTNNTMWSNLLNLGGHYIAVIPTSKNVLINE